MSCRGLMDNDLWQGGTRQISMRHEHDTRKRVASQYMQVLASAHISLSEQFENRPAGCSDRPIRFGMKVLTERAVFRWVSSGLGS